MSSVLRSVRKRKKARRLGPVEIIGREDYADLELDAKVELIRSLVPLGLMPRGGIARRGVDGAGWRALRPQGRVGRRAPVMAATPGTVGLAGQRVPIRVPRIRHVAGERDRAAVLRGVAWRSRGQRPAAEARAVRDLVPQLRSRRRGDSGSNRAVGVNGVPGVH